MAKPQNQKPPFALRALAAFAVTLAALFVLLLAAYVLVKIVFTEAGRVPVDDPRTHLELTMIHEVMCLDYCGTDLGMIKIAGWLKTAALSMLAADAVTAATYLSLLPVGKVLRWMTLWDTAPQTRPMMNFRIKVVMA